jgi:tRNA(Ile)-lysidine synthase
MSRSELSPIEQSVDYHLDRHFGSKSFPSFIIAVSGGMDSMALLHAFYQLDVSALVSHVNYQKRGAASDKDAELVEQMAFEWGFECHTVEADPTAGQGQNFQQWARDLRYRVFAGLMEEYNADGIAVAHHEDDQVETILQKVFRGAGLASWSGMDIWDGQLFRPLLDCSGADIKAYVEDQAIPYRTDESNLENDFARNFLRNEWLEKLNNFFPGWKENVLRMRREAETYQQALSFLGDELRNKRRAIDRDAFHSLTPDLQKSLVLNLLKETKPGLQISKESLERIAELADLQTGREIELAPQVSILRDRDNYVISMSDINTFEPLTLDRDAVDASKELDAIKLSINDYQNPDFEHTLYLDADKLSWPVTVRRWQAGDQFQPLGMKGHQNVSDHLTNRKISASRKKEALVIESFDKTICAIIFPPIQNQSPPGTISDQCKCTADTQECLEIRHIS